MPRAESAEPTRAHSPRAEPTNKFSETLLCQEHTKLTASANTRKRDINIFDINDAAMPVSRSENLNAWL